MSGNGAAGNRGGVRGVFIFALLAAFALLSLVVVVVGVRSYRMINASAERAFVCRTGLSYLASKVRGADAAGGLEIREESGLRVLALGQEIGGEQYTTYIYCDGAQVREYFARAGLAFSPDYGEGIFDATALEMTLAHGLLSIALVDAGGQTHSIALCLQAAEGSGA